MTKHELLIWREERELSQRQLAKLLGVSASTVARWESQNEARIPPHWLQWALPEIERNMRWKR